MRHDVERFADALAVTLGHAAHFNMAHATQEFCEFLKALEYHDQRGGTHTSDNTHEPPVMRCMRLAAQVRNSR